MKSYLFDNDFRECKKIASSLQKITSSSLKFRELESKADKFLALEFIVITLLTLLFIFYFKSVYLKLLILIPWSIYSSLTIDNIIHYYNHSNFFRNRWANLIWRSFGILTFNFITEQKYHHWQHHKFDNTLDDPLTTLKSETEHQTFHEFVIKDIFYYYVDLIPMSKFLPDYIKKLKLSKTFDYVEILINRLACLIFLVVILFLDFHNAIFFYIPFVILIPPIVTFTMSLTDHVPGNPSHTFQLATYLNPQSKLEKLYSFLNHYSAATHLTHHLFPYVHWLYLPKLQRRISNYYTKFDSPQSIVINSFLIGNPFSLLNIITEVKKHKSIKMNE